MRRRRVVILGAAGVLATLALSAIFHRPIISHVVTALAFRDAERLAVEADQATDLTAWNRATDRAADAISSKYGHFFSRGFLDRMEVASRFPPGLTREAVPAIIVIRAFYGSERSRGSKDREFEVFEEELAEWLDPVATLPGPKEFLVNVLVTSVAFLPGPEKQSGDGLMKLAIFTFFFCEGRHPLLDCMEVEELGPMKARLVGLVRPEHWAAVIRHTEHPREKVRAGSLLLLNRHPSEEMTVETARRALGDPSEWVQLAGAGLLAIRGLDEGEYFLAQGLYHDRWEVRFWCVFGLFALAKPGLAGTLDERLAVEKDEWLKGVLRDAIKHLREAPR